MKKFVFWVALILAVLFPAPISIIFALIAMLAYERNKK